MVARLELHGVRGYAEQSCIDRINRNLNLPDLDDHSGRIGDSNGLRKHHAVNGSVIRELFLIYNQNNVAGYIDTYLVFARIVFGLDTPGLDASDFAPGHTLRSGPDKKNIPLRVLRVPATIEFKGPGGRNEHFVGIKVILVSEGDSRFGAASHRHIDPGTVAIAINGQRSRLLFACPGIYHYRCGKNVGPENHEIRRFVGRVDELPG